MQHPEPEVFNVRVLARMDHPDLGDMPVAWVKPYGDGRSFYTALGHFRSAFEGEARALLGAGVRWAGGRA
ncbi:ThuA domain-containing protein [Halorhabdus tiamatea]|uniref:ThuA domain-containing protein n=1 Tax=Halorhabdus tiamatea TaxID=430914 RepID=UPI0023A91927|nr:ThuA domain-containing protein [Halorhabdus tiamatea]